MTVLLHEITRLRREVNKWRQRAYELERSREMWKTRALSYGRGGAGQSRRRAA